MVDMQLEPTMFAFNSTSEPFGDPRVAKDAFMARMAELVRDYVASPVQP